MIEPELKYCPKCKDEYMPHAQKCAACEVELVTGEMLLVLEEERRNKRESRAGEISAEEDLVVIHKGQLADLKYLHEKLAEIDIPSRVAGDDTSCGQGCCPQVFYLQVRREDAPEVLQVIQEEHKRETCLDEYDTKISDAVFDEDAPEVLCPACGYKFSPEISTCPECGLCFGG